MWRIFSGCAKEAGQRTGAGAGLRGEGAWSTSTAICQKDSDARPGDTGKDGKGAGTKTRKERFCHQEYRIGATWFEAISWSGAIAMGWYVSQLACLSWRKRKWLDQVTYNQHVHTNCPIWEKVNTLKSTFLPIKAYTQPETLHEILVSKGIAENKWRNINLKNVSLESDAIPEPIVDKPSESLDFADVLNQIENKLGILAIENGDLKKGITMLHSAAQRNYGPAQYNLALCYENGVGMKKNEKAALELYIAAAGENHPGALYNLAVFYGQGRGGLNRDTATAEKFLHLAAENGQEDAVKALHEMAKEDQNQKNQKPSNVHYEVQEPLSPTEMFLNLLNIGKTTNQVASVYSKVY